MRQRNRFVSLVVLALLLCPFIAMPAPALAQNDDIPTAREQRQTLEDGGLPEITDFGTGWSLSGAFTAPPAADFTFELHEGHYADRWGTRIHIYAAIHDRRSEDDAVVFGQYLIDTYANIVMESPTGPSAREVRDLDDPAACEVVSRVVGEEPIALFHFGSILCHDLANDRVLVVSVSGNYDGMVFQEAAEAVLEIVLDIEPGG